jgi:RsiW-degrading membrane proteinase PrsW (M82 family)
MAINLGSPLFLFLLGLFPSLFWLLFFLLEDSKKPEPKGMIAEVFAAGVVSAFVAIILEGVAVNYLASNLIFKLNTSLEFIVFAFIEESVIFLAAYFTVARKRLMDEHVNSMVYLITSALGFAALENVLYILTAGPGLALQTTLIRSVGATLLHAVASGFIGFYWAEGKLVRGIVVATLIHFTFDYLAFSLAEQTYSIAFVLICSFLIFHDFDILKSEDNGRNTKQR